MKIFNGKGGIARETMLLIGILALVTLVCRLWPLLLLMILSLFVALSVLLFRVTEQTQTDDTKPVLMFQQEPSRLPTQNYVYDIAYAVILRQITELVCKKYPQARWIWEASDTRQLIETGENVFMLLNRAGGYN